MKHDGRSPDRHLTGKDPAPEVEEELAHHLEQRVREYQEQGMSLDEARAAARERMGDLGSVRSECTRLLANERRSRARREWIGFSWLDFKLGFRMLARYPGLTVVGGLAMAFGIWVGACTFELSKQWVRPNLALDEASRLVGLQQRNSATGELELVGMQEFITWREALRSLEELSAFRLVEWNLSVPGNATEPVQVAEITASGFSAARVPPLLGRVLVEADESPAAPPVLVIGYGIWQTLFQADPNVVGRTVQLGSGSATVVGVMPEGFAFPVMQQVWTPLAARGLATGERGPAVRAFGRLARGYSLGDAQVEMDHVGLRAAADYPETYAQLRPQVMPYASSILSMRPDEVVAVSGVNVAVVLLVVLACGNVALLMFARAATRESEIIVRNALGASRGRIVMQLLAEALVLGGVGTLIGLAAARWGMRLAVLMLTGNLGELPYWVNSDLSPLTLVYAVALTILGAVVAGVVPALRVSRSLGTQLRQASAGAGGLKFSGVWTAVIVAQVAVTVTFPVGATMIARLGAPIRSFDVGFEESEYLSAQLVLDFEAIVGASPGAADETPRARARRTLEELERRLSAEANVAGVTFANRLPRTYHPTQLLKVVEDVPTDGDSLGLHAVKTASVDAGYFDLLGAPVLAGRGFQASDAESGQRVVIVNQTFVQEVLRGRNPIGQQLRIGTYEALTGQTADPAQWFEVIGVVPDLGMYHEDTRAGLYHPISIGFDRVFAMVKVRGDPAAFAPRLRSVAHEVDPMLRVMELATLSEVSGALARVVVAVVRTAFLVSAVALLLSLAAIYSVMSFAVSRRTREIGLRVALGASIGGLLLAVFRRPLTQVGFGILLGGVMVALLVRSVVGQLTPREIGMVVAYAAVMMGVCMLACVVPTVRALRIEPTDALREEA